MAYAGTTQFSTYANAVFTIIYYFTLKIVTTDRGSIIAPTWCRLICTYRCRWYINFSAVSVVEKQIISPCWWSCRLTIYTFQRGAIIECIISNRSNAIRNSNACQRGAIIECTLANLSHTITNCHTCQRGAVIVFTTDY